jgi:hypothetical protein
MWIKQASVSLYTAQLSLHLDVLLASPTTPCFGSLCLLVHSTSQSSPKCIMCFVCDLTSCTLATSRWAMVSLTQMSPSVPLLPLQALTHSLGPA